MNIRDLPNYRCSDRPPRHRCAPFRSLADEDVAAGRTIDDEWPVIEGDVLKVLRRHPRVKHLGSDLDRGCNTGFIRIGSHEPDALVACVADLRRVL